MNGFMASINNGRNVHTRAQKFWFYSKIVAYVLLPFIYLSFIIYYINHIGTEIDYQIAVIIAITFLILAWLVLYLIYRTTTIFYYGHRLYKITTRIFRISTLLILFFIFIIPTFVLLTLIYFI